MTILTAADATRRLLVARQGRVVLDELGGDVLLPDDLVRTIELGFANLGLVMSHRLRARIASLDVRRAGQWARWIRSAYAEHIGALAKHEPLFRKFPEDVPRDTTARWVRRVLVHFAQAPEQPCLFCREIGTTHVLSCHHVVCDRCFDGENYSACPVCERKVDRSSPFFKPSAKDERAPGAERVRFKLLDLGDDLAASARHLFEQLTQRTQALSPDDRVALLAIVTDFADDVPTWVPPTIPVRENIALVFGTLLRGPEPLKVMDAASDHLTTATDVLRTLAVYSGADASLQGTAAYIPVNVEQAENSKRWAEGTLARAAKTARGRTGIVPIVRRRFPVARISRPLRRRILAQLESLTAAALSEDMLGHRSLWVWVGRFLHPHEYAKRFPKVARAFHLVRRKDPRGVVAEPFRGFASQVERTLERNDVPAALALLAKRPGELGRRLDHLARLASGDAKRQGSVVERFVAAAPRLSTPLLLTLWGHLPKRANRAPLRLFWPKGQVAKGYRIADRRTTLPSAVIEPAVSAIEAELLRRFAALPRFELGVVDRELSRVVMPFNERTATPSAVAVPKGSTLPIDTGKRMRVFLHWCQPKTATGDTDLDLSVAFYNDAWDYVGVCSYYELTFNTAAGLVAQSAGDSQDAPFPDGATEFVDVDLEIANKANVRYAVMVVNAFAGLPFNCLERAYAGLMMRDSPNAAHFDPRTVELKFGLSGDNGVYIPLVVDLRGQQAHWLDVYKAGDFSMNTAASSGISSVCPTLLDYFAHGSRPSMHGLAMLHVAARCTRVVIRDEGFGEYRRQDNESVPAFFRRLCDGSPDAVHAALPSSEAPMLAALFRGDVAVPAGSAVYAVFREQTVPTMAASDFVVGEPSP